MGLVALYTVVGFFVVPPIARSQLEKRLSAELGRRVTVEKVRLNPYAMSVTLEKLAVLEADNTTPFVAWRRLFVNADPCSSWKEWVVKEIELDGFESRVAVNPDHTFNFSDILTKLAPPGAQPAPATSPEKPAKPPRPVRIGSVRVADARVDFSDRSRAKPFATTIGPLTFALTEFRTVSERGAPYRFEAVTESGEKLAWAGTLQAEPPASTGELAIENIVLAKYAPYYADLIQADLVDGKLSVRGRYEVSLAEGKRVAQLHAGSVALRGIKVLERSTQESALELPSLDVSGIDADATTQKATIDLIAVNGGQLRARREKDGAINWLRMLEAPAVATAPAPSPPAAEATPAPTPSSIPPAPAKPDVTIGEFALKDFRVEIADQAVPRPTQFVLGEIQFSLRTISLAEGVQMPMQLAFNWAPQGSVRLDGNVMLTPLKADLTLDLATFDLLPVSPYLEQFVNARLTQGTVTGGLIIDAAMTAGQPPAATVAGGMKLEKFGLVDGTHNEELAGVDEVTLRGLRASTAPELTLTLDDVNIAAPFARIVVGKDKVLNLASIVKSAPAPSNSTKAPGAETQPVIATTPSTGPAATNPSAPAATAAPLPKIEIGKITIRDGDFRFTDRSVDPNVTMAINKFGGTIAGLSSTNPAKADLDLQAMVDGAG
ncbi:MAG: DUF748 domain-containing protein, partial [Opitutaceae bacterium]